MSSGAGRARGSLPVRHGAGKILDLRYGVAGLGATGGLSEVIATKNGSRATVFAKASCTIIDVWLPAKPKSKNTLEAPSMNDPNASVVLDITPPSGERIEGCTFWRYHYGETPPPKHKKNDKRDGSNFSGA